MNLHRLRFLVAGLALVATASAHAHAVEGGASGFIAGFIHPLLGLDHVAAMVAVGLWGGFLGRPAIWVLPVVFPLVMAFGGALGIVGVPIPGVEIGIALSAVVLGAMVLTAARPPLPLAAAIVAAFAIFHGHAHGTELPHASSAILYSLGFVVSTGLLHLAGIGIGHAANWRHGRALVRGAGGVITAAGLFFLVQSLS